MKWSPQYNVGSGVALNSRRLTTQRLLMGAKNYSKPPRARGPKPIHEIVHPTSPAETDVEVIDLSGSTGKQVHSENTPHIQSGSLLHVSTPSTGFTLTTSLRLLLPAPALGSTITHIALCTSPPPPSSACPTTPAKDIPFNQFASFMKAAACGHSQLKYLFPKVTMDKHVLFGDNFNYRFFPTDITFPVQNLISHFACTQVIPLELAVIVLPDYKPPQEEACVCYAITINDLPFQARVVPFHLLLDTIDSCFTFGKKVKEIF